MNSLEAVERLITTYQHLPEQPVRFRPGSWSAVDDSAYSLLVDPALTVPAKRESRDRVVHRETLEDFAGRTSLDDAETLRKVFVLVMAWGSGTSNPRSYRYTRAALDDPDLNGALQATAALCRDADMNSLREAYATWQVSGVRRSFFTKWFRFAGYTAGRTWQPLILDERVLLTLNSTLDISLREVAGTRRWADRYVTYVRLVHQWADALDGVTAQRIEWAMFLHNGRNLSDTATGR